ncbi:hypothetical protein [Thiomonas sp. X19]|uniref:hypothetical protein n=1 Tax=Thiomonas sp. X19 TaxID=1050370 RepID=UPI001E493A5C|nr:hypothetical protein [Thiomonas sp. X19]
MGKAARQRKREARDLVKVWTPRMWWFFWTLFVLATAAWLGDAVHQHAAGLAWGQAAFAGLPATMLVLTLGLLPILLMLPLIYFERDLKNRAAETALAAFRIAEEMKKTASSMLALAETAVNTVSSILHLFLAWSPQGLGVNQTLVYLTPRILAQQPIAARD